MSGFRSILVPLDGSDYAVQALPLAERLARQTGAALHLVLVHQATPAWYIPGAAFPAMVDIEDEARCREQQYIESVAARSSAGTPLSVTSTILDGDISTVICQFVKDKKVDLVVMTTHGRSGLSRFWLGSVADKLMRSLDIPVLITHPVHDGDITHAGIRRILVPLDGSGLAESILEQARTIARLADAELILGMVVEPIPVLLPPMQYPLAPPQDEEAREIEGRLYLHAVGGRLLAEGFQSRIKVVRGRNAARQILQLAAREHCDLIVIATHGAGGLDRIIMGSVADQVVRGSAVPVLVLRPAGDPDLERAKTDAAAEPPEVACSVGG